MIRHLQLIRESLAQHAHIRVDLDECLEDLADKSECEDIIQDVFQECRRMGNSPDNAGMLAVRILKRMINAWQAGVAYEADQIGESL